MRPLELSLEGFTSFRSCQTLDFSNLDLFAITGPTGAGKTSLLDAITFALYGHVARFGKQDAASELVTQGSQNLKVSFRFLVRGVEYRVTRTWRYRPSTPENKVLLERLCNGSWEKLETKEKSVTKRVEQILGMDYETFTKVILLPQGQFDEFLKGNAAKRREILIELAGFTIFDRMHTQAEKLAYQIKNEYEAVERQLTALEAPTIEAVTDKQRELIALEQQLPTLSQAVLQAQKALDEEEKLLADMTRLARLQQELELLLVKGNEIENLQARLEQACIADRIGSKYALFKDAKKRDEQAQTALKLAQEHFAQAQIELAARQAELDEVTAEQKSVEPRLKAREEALAAAKGYEEQRWQYELEVEGARRNQTQRADALTKVAREFEKAQLEEQAASNEATEAETALAQYSPGGSRLQQLIRVVPLLERWQAQNQQVRSQLEKLETAVAERSDAIATCEAAALELETASLALQEIQTVRQAAEAANRAALLRMSLHVGDTCSVCGGVYPEMHQLPLLPKSSSEEIASLQRREATALESYQTARSAVDKAQTKLEFYQQQELKLAEEIDASQAQLAKMQQQIDTLLQTDTWEVEALDRERERLQSDDAKYHQALAARQEAAAQLRETQQALQLMRDRHATALAESQTANEELERRQQQLQEVESKLHQIVGGQSYQTLQQALTQERQAIELKVQQVSEAYAAANTSLIGLQTAERQARTTASEQQLQKEQRQTAWEEALQSVGLSEDSFLLAQADPGKQAEWQTAIANYQRQKIRLETQVMEVAQIVGDRVTSDSAIELKRDAKQAADRKLQQTHDRLVDLQVWINSAESKLQQSDRLTSELSRLQQQTQTYSTLARNLKSDRFQAYILEHLEAELVASATLRLQELTDRRYALKVQTGEYWVEDNWNGGERRRLQTLSGGETFATSLSMALALSEKLSMGAELGSLFLDEGFGTLDPDTLESATQILESLRQQDRLIGVITHIRELGERLPTQVKVQKSLAGSKLVVEAG